jgi:hypothetical protein
MLLLTYVLMYAQSMLVYQSNWKTSAEARGKVSQFRQSTVNSDSYPVQMEKVNIKKYGTRSQQNSIEGVMFSIATPSVGMLEKTKISMQS